MQSLRGGRERGMGVGTRLRQGMHLRVALRCCDIALFRLHPLRACLTWRLHTTAHHCCCPCYTLLAAVVVVIIAHILKYKLATL